MKHLLMTALLILAILFPLAASAQDASTPLFNTQQTDAFWDGAAKVASSEALFDACQLADLGTTIYALHTGFVEVNPVLAAIGVGTGSYGALIAVKLGIIGLIHWLEPEDLTLANGLSCGVAVHNLLVVF